MKTRSGEQTFFFVFNGVSLMHFHRGGQIFSAKGYLNIYKITLGPYKISNLKQPAIYLSTYLSILALPDTVLPGITTISLGSAQLRKQSTGLPIVFQRLLFCDVFQTANQNLLIPLCDNFMV